MTEERNEIAMIKAVFFDIDGTLYSHTTGSVPSSARKALDSLRKNGIRTYVASGRGMDSLKTLDIDDISFDGYVMYNGQLCYDCDRKYLTGNPVSEEGQAVLRRLFREKELPVILVGRDRSVINLINSRTREVQRDFNLTIPPLGNAEDVGTIYQALALATREEEAAFSGTLTDCRITRWFPKGIDIIPANGSKIAGIRKIAELDGIRPDEIMCIGDSENDIEMLRGARIGIAMGNADEKTRRAADFVTTDIDRDGILNALLHYGLISA